MSKLIILLLSLCLLGSAGEPAKDKKPDAKPKVVEVILSFSTVQLDPFDPGKHHVKCIVRNISKKAVYVPTVYTGGFSGDMSLIAPYGGLELDLVAWAGEKKQVLKTLEPGKEMVVFQDTLRDVLLLDFKDDKTPPLVPGEKRYYWHWSA